MSKYLTPRRLDQIIDRQFPIRFGPDYVPAILANKQEAPAISRPAVRYSARLGRTVQALSISELNCIVLALHHPKVFDLRENHAYNCAPAQHPLATHPRCSTLKFGSTEGTLAIAERLGLPASMHPIARQAQRSSVANDHADEAPQAVTRRGSSSKSEPGDPGYFIGDLLIFLSDDVGPYAVDWDIKARVGDHARPGPLGLQHEHSSRAIKRASSRDAIVRAYNADLGIRTLAIAGEEIDRTVIGNLLMLMGWHHRPIAQPKDEIDSLIDEISRSMVTRVSPIALMDSWTSAGWTREQFLCAIYTAMWERRILVDLFHPIVIDRPLRPASRDVFDVYGHWFSR